MQKQIKVLFITGKLQHYRVPIFNLIVKMSNFDLTVAHSSKKISKDTDLFKEVILDEIKISRFTIHKNNLVSFCNNFDVVVSMLYLQKLSFMRLLYVRNRKYKLIYWGIGLKASQKSEFDTPTFLNKIRFAIAKKSDAMIFYTNYAREKYIANNIDSEKLFVMNNTVQVNNHYIEEVNTKDCILFVGTLNKSKKIFSLLEAYKSALSKHGTLPRLEIVGEGVEYEDLKTWVNENNLFHKIILHGSIYNPNDLERLFKRTLACISPGQAGLSVLTSFGYGVPFITSHNAITGGERLNIKNNYNGILFKTNAELENIIMDIEINQNKYLKMGINARLFYLEERSPKIMAQGFIDAVKHVIK